MVSAASRMSRAISFGVFCRLAPFDQRDHAVEERFAWIRGDLDDEPVGQHLRAAGDRAAVAAALTDHRRALTGDRRLVHRCDAFDDCPVGRDEIAGLDEHVLPFAETRSRDRARHRAARSGREQSLGLRYRAALYAATPACALPRPSAMASAKLAKSTVNQSQTETQKMNQAGASPLPTTA